MSQRRTENREDELEELPPIDGDDDDFREADEGLEGSLEVPSPDGPGWEDSGAQDLEAYATDFRVQEEASWVDEENDASDLNLGSGLLADLGKEPVSLDDATLGEAEDDLQPWDEPPSPARDGGDEGPLALDEELRDEDLPALDADDSGEGADASFMDAGFASDELLGVQWARHPWSQVGAPLRLNGARAIVCAGRYALVAADAQNPDGVSVPSLAYIDLEGGCTSVRALGLPSKRVNSLANDGTDHGLVGMVLEDGQLCVSTDGGQRFELEACRDACACSVALGVVWACTETGFLLAKTGAELKRYPVPLPVDSLAADGPTALYALLAGGGTGKPMIARFGAEASFISDPVEPPVERAWGQAAVEDGTTATSVRPLKRAGLAARAGHVAYSVKGGILRRGVDNRWRLASGWEGRVTAMTFIDNQGTLLAAVCSDVDDTSALIRIDGRGRPALVAQVARPRDASDADVRVFDLACDEMRGIVWVASGLGVTAFSMGPD